MKQVLKIIRDINYANKKPRYQVLYPIENVKLNINFLLDLKVLNTTDISSSRKQLCETYRL